MWEKVREGYGEFREFWRDSTWRGKLSMFLGTVIGIMWGTSYVHYELAKQGCSMKYGAWEYFGYGLLGLVMIIGGFVFGGLLIRGLIYIPTYMKERRESAEWRRKDREERKRYLADRKRELGYRFIEPERLEKIKFWAIIGGSLFVIVVSVSIALGYIWWHIFC